MKPVLERGGFWVSDLGGTGYYTTNDRQHTHRRPHFPRTCGF